jgi:hypothetical protein
MADGAGLYLEIDPSGGKYWRFKYRRSGKEKRISLGVYPEVSLANAREARDRCRKQLAQGIDPGVARKAQTAVRDNGDANSFEVIAREWLQEHVDPKSESIASASMRGSKTISFRSYAVAPSQKSLRKSC